ncbi:MAG: hypothetical protein FJX51_01080 [Alphaproteobacteria bacterium]|nr:hypothetical protein [Alphaproteobacteria bacterium]
MGFDEKIDRSGVTSSCADLLRFQAMFHRHFAGGPVAAFGPKGEDAVMKGLHRYGLYRANLIKAKLKKKKAKLTARTLIEQWDMADYHMLTETGSGRIEGSERTAVVTFHDSHDWERWREYDDGAALARLYYAGVLPGIAKGLGAKVSFDVRALDLKRPWSVTWNVAGAREGERTPIHSKLFDRTKEGIEVARRTSMNNGALYYFCGDEETKVFDMQGEAALREQVRALAIERATRQKKAHTAQGWELNVKTLMDHWDGQLISIWKFKKGLLNEGTWHQDCTECPYASAWEGLGKRAMDLGYLYDYELHPTYYRHYHPDMIVQFEAIKTRGDSMCKFRVSLPGKQKNSDPAFKGYTGKDV